MTSGARWRMAESETAFERKGGFYSGMFVRLEMGLLHRAERRYQARAARWIGQAQAVPGTAIANGIAAVPQVSVSPDGKTLAFIAALAPKGDPNGSITKIALVPLDAGPQPQLRLLDADPRMRRQLRFSPDGKSLVYSIRENGVENLWMQPLDGTRGHQLTGFTTERIEAYHWSPDGKSIGMIRAHTDADVVLLRDAQQ